MMEDKKIKFLEYLTKAKGIIEPACQMARITRRTYYNWKAQDQEFKAAVEDVMETQADWVESKLLELIEAKDTTAIIFYSKTKMKHRGYSEKAPIIMPEQPQVVEAKATEVKQIEGPQVEREDKAKKRIKAKKAYLVKLLKDQNKYTPELAMQCDLAAQLLVRTETLAAEIFGEGYEAVKTQYSREGAERQTVNAKEKLYMDYLQQSQRALRALGMNTDSKERHSDGDTFGDFMKQFENDD